MRTGTVSIQLDGVEIERAEALFKERGVVMRAGQHCAPLALEAIGALAGTLRISFGPLNDDDDLAGVLAAIDSILAPG